MKIIRLFVDFEFTSLSPDAQPISVGVVSDSLKPCDFPELYPTNGLIATTEYKSFSFYSEFTDFDLNRCDDWVKENVVRKLKMFDGSDCIGISNENALKMMNSGISCVSGFKYNLQVIGSISEIKSQLISWLSQFSDYEIQVVVDCGTWDWYWFLQLVAEWDEVEVKEFDSFVGTIKLHHVNIPCRIGLPKLPSNISPVPFDLNDLIAIKKGISPKEAFDLSRSWLFNNELSVYDDQQCVVGHKMVEYENAVHNSLFDAKVIKAIYNKLMNQ